jgi:peptide/nickel transport system substrate-binding protein
MERRLQYAIMNVHVGKKFRAPFLDSSMHGRTRLLRSFLGLSAVIALAGLFLHDPGASAQGPKKMRVEEEEEPPEKSKIPKKVEESEPTGRPQPPPGGKFDYAKEIGKATNPVIRDLLRRLAIPYDLLVPNTGITPYKIALMPERDLPDNKFTYFELNATLDGGQTKELPTGSGFSLRPYEEIVLERLNLVLDAKMASKLNGVTRADLEEMAVQILQSTRILHAAWIEQKKRSGKGWEAVDDKLRQRIIQLRRDQLKASIDAKDWRRADELSQELSNYSNDPAARKDIYRLLLRKALEALRPDHEEDFAALRDAVTQFENLAGGHGDEIAAKARRQLSNKASQFAEAAKKHAEANQNATAFQLLKSAEALDPDLPAILELRKKLRDRVLYVGVARLPERMSPTSARGDAERWAMDLLFESLLQAVPDVELGRRFRPVLAARAPGLAPLGREFTLVKNARWGGDGGKSVDARDVFGTIELLQKAPYLPDAEGVELLDADQVRIANPLQVRLGFRQGLLEPLGRTTFKILPARYLKAEGKGAADDLFAQHPFGSGPYRYEGREPEGGDRGDAAVFRANPYFSQRPGKFGLPNIREVRFVAPRLSSAPADIAGGQLHLILDVPTGDVPRYRDDPLSAGKVNVHTLKLNRRIFMLAINHRRPVLQNVELRRGLAAAIDRDTILNDVYRAEAGKANHTALSGPFPLNCWATPEKARKPEAALFNPALAGGLLSAAAGRGRIALRLKYPEDDPLAARACGKIKEQIEAAGSKAPGEASQVEIILEAAPGNQLLRQLEQEQDFELAYVSYDYRDDLYWLGSLLDRTAAGRGGRNYLGYLAPGGNPQPDDNALRVALDDIRAHRDFRANVREETWKVHFLFLGRMPFVPLWQLDRHIIVHRNLELFLDNDKLAPEQIDPSAVFAGVEGWKLK